MKGLVKNIIKNPVITGFLFILTLAFSGPNNALAATTPDLGAAADFAVLSSTFTNANTAPLTDVTGDIGYTVAGAPITPVLFHTGDIHAENGTFNQAGIDQGTALTDLNNQACTVITGPLDATVIGANAPGVFPPGCYTMATDLIITLSTSITLDLTADGGVGETWIFKSTGGGLTTGSDSFVTLANGASACDVFWAPVAAANIGAYTGALPNTTKPFIGTIIDAAGISLGHFATLSGRALAFGGTVTTDANKITVPTCDAPAEPTSGSGSARRGTLNVVKTVINDNGRTKITTDFPLFVNGNQVQSGVTYSYLADGNVDTVSETTDVNYTATFSGDCDVNGDVYMSEDEDKFCIITNDDIGSPIIVPPVPPLIALVKVPNPLSLPSGPGPVTYSYTLTNIGTVPVTDITMVGDTCGPIVLQSGDTNADSKLDVNETWVYQCSKTLTETHTNTVVATGWANGISAVDIASAKVVVGEPIVPPLINVTKVPTPLTLPAGGGTVTYNLRVTNPGTVALNNVNVSDDKCDSVKYLSGDTNNDSLLDPNERWRYSCVSNLTKSTTNTVMASGGANGLRIRDIAVATVPVATAVPKLPETGSAPEKNWPYAAAGLLILISASAVIVLKKRGV